MTMRLALARATVTGPDGNVYEDVTVSTRAGRLVAVARNGGRVLDVEATAVNPVAGQSRSWTVETTAGVFTVDRAKGCGCGS